MPSTAASPGALRTSRPGLILCTLVWAATPAFAAGEAGADQQRVVVTGQAQQPDPQVHNVDTERLKRALARDLRDVFETEPSVTAGNGSRNGMKVFLRGIDDLNLNLQIDGARQGANLFHHQGRVDIDPFLLKRVEVAAGPAAADAGPGALGGSVRFETVDAQDLLRPRQALGGWLGLQSESADRLRGGVASAYGLVGDTLGLLAYARRQVNDEMRPGGGGRQPSSDGSRGSLLLKATLLDQSGHTLRASVERSSNEGGALRANYPWQVNNAVQAADAQRFVRETSSLRHRWRPDAWHWVNLQTTLYRTDSRIELEGRNPTGSGRGARWRTRSDGGDLRNVFVFDAGQAAHALTLGLDHFDDQGINESPNDPRLTETARNTGLFVQDRVDFGGLRLSAGLRLDRYRTRYANGRTTGGSRVSPNVGVEWDPLPAGGHDLTVFAGVGRSIRGGKLNQAGWLTKYFLPPGFTVPRPFTLGEGGVLRPEQGRQVQAGLRWHMHGLFAATDHAGVEVTFFDTRIRDYQVVPGEGVGGVTDRIYNASGDVTSRGQEWRAHWGSRGWHVGASFARGKVRNYDGLPMDTTGESARVGVSVGDRLVLDTRWKLSPAWQFGHTLTAVKRLREVPPASPEKPGYSVHGLQAVWLPMDSDVLTLTFGVDNLFDKRYAQHAAVRVTAATSTASAQAGQTYASLEPGRSLKLSADWRF